MPNQFPYKTYAVKVTQSGTDPVIPNVFENTTGQNITWFRDDEGSYYTNPISGNVYIPGFARASVWEAMTMIPVTDNNGTLKGYYGFSQNAYDYGLYLKTFGRPDLNQVEFNVLFGSGGLFLPEVRVYP